MQGFHTTLFKVRPRVIRAAQGIGLLGVLLAAGAALLRWSSWQAGEAIPLIDCLCAPRLPTPKYCPG